MIVCASARARLRAPGDVLVMGAGTIGCFIGGCLAAAGVPVLLRRPPARARGAGAARPDAHRPRRRRRALPPAALQLPSRCPPASRPALVLLTVKSGATARRRPSSARRCRPARRCSRCRTASRTRAAAQAAAPTLHVLPGMVPYNVAEIGPGAFHRGTAGRLAAQDDAALRPWLPRVRARRRADRPARRHAPMQWGKLLLNLNNPVNALSGLPLRAQLLRPRLSALPCRADGRGAGCAATPPPSRRRSWRRCRRAACRRAAAADAAVPPGRGAHAAHRRQGALQHGRRPGARPPHRDRRAVRRGGAAGAGRNGARAPINAKMVELLEAWPERPHALSAQELPGALDCARLADTEAP